MKDIYPSMPRVSQCSSRVELPIPDWSMIEAFERSARRAPDAPAIYHFDETISFGRLDDLAGRFAALLGKWGIGKGDRVAVSLQNDPEFAIAELGAWKRGAILVPLNPMFKEKEVAYHLADSGARVWVVLDSAYAELAPASGVERVITARDLMDAVAAESPGAVARVAVASDDIAFLVSTSGTTAPAT